MIALGTILEADGQPTLEVVAVENGSYICRDPAFGPNYLMRGDEIAGRYGQSDTEISEKTEQENWQEIGRRVRANTDADRPEQLPTPNEVFGDTHEIRPDGL